MSDVVVRELSTVAECAAVTPLTWQVWGPSAPVFSVDLLRAVVHTGGYLAGAFQEFPCRLAKRPVGAPHDPHHHDGDRETERTQ